MSFMLSKINNIVTTNNNDNYTEDERTDEVVTTISNRTISNDDIPKTTTTTRTVDEGVEVAPVTRNDEQHIVSVGKTIDASIISALNNPLTSPYLSTDVKVIDNNNDNNNINSKDGIQKNNSDTSTPIINEDRLSSTPTNSIAPTASHRSSYNETDIDYKQQVRAGRQRVGVADHGTRGTNATNVGSNNNSTLNKRRGDCNKISESSGNINSNNNNNNASRMAIIQGEYRKPGVTEHRPQNFINETTEYDDTINSNNNTSVTTLPTGPTSATATRSATTVTSQLLYDDVTTTTTTTTTNEGSPPMVVAYLVGSEDDLEDNNRRKNNDEEAQSKITAVQNEKDTIERKFNNWKRNVILVTIILILIGIGIGTYVSLRPKDTSTNNNDNNNNNNNTTHTPFTTTDELYEAVDILIASKSKNVIALQQYGPTINDWDVSRITNFSRLFDPNRGSPFSFANFNMTNIFNETIRNWNTSSATTMHAMFASAVKFNQDLSKWDVSRVTDMSNMFGQTWNFNQNLSLWDTSNVVNMSYMFYNSSRFNGDISTWHTSKVRNMSDMFNWCTSLGNNTRYSKAWDTSSVQQMRGMFRNAHKWDSPDLGDWNVSNVQRMDLMFSNAYQFTNRSAISRWDVSNVQNMSFIFTNATSFNENLSTWNISKVQAMTRMFQNAVLFQQNLCTWGRQIITNDTINVTGMFTNTSCVNQADPVISFLDPWCYSPCITSR